MRKWIAGKKQYMIAIAAAIGAVSTWAAGDLSTMNMVAAIIGALALAANRAAIQKAVDASKSE